MIIDLKRKLPNFKAIEAFLAAAESNSFAEAARAKGCTTAALSMQIKNLEKKVGRVLIDRARKGKGISLTPAGKKYFKQVESLIKALSPESFLTEPIPVITDHEFEDAIQDAQEDILEFWSNLRSLDFDLSKDPELAHKVRSVSVILRQRYGGWVYESIGRRSAFAAFAEDPDIEKKLRGRSVILHNKTDKIDPFNYEISKVYHIVNVTGDPNLSTVEGTAERPNGSKFHGSYTRIIAKAKDQHGPILVSYGRINTSQPITQITETRIMQLPIQDIDHYAPILRQFYDLVQARPLWYDREIEQLHEHCFMVSTRLPVNNSMVVSHIGRLHASRKQFGDAWATKHLHNILDGYDSLGDEYIDETGKGYHEVMSTGEPRLDLVFSNSELVDGEPVGLLYTRLMMRLFDRNGGEVVAQIVTDMKRFSQDCPAEDAFAEAISGSR